MAADWSADWVGEQAHLRVLGVSLVRGGVARGVLRRDAGLVLWGSVRTTRSLRLDDDYLTTHKHTNTHIEVSDSDASAVGAASGQLTHLDGLADSRRSVPIGR